jgi:hypothetical protein
MAVDTAWFEVVGGTRSTARAAWQHVALPERARILADTVALTWRAMDGFYEEDDRTLGHAADPYHRIDVRRTSRHVVVRAGGRVVADTTKPLALYESGFAPRWYVPRGEVIADATVGEQPGHTEAFALGDQLGRWVKGAHGPTVPHPPSDPNSGETGRVQ